jgi:hypothetical protein
VSKLTKHFKSPHIHISLATGFSILAMACASKWLLSEPIGYLELAAPPFLATIYESVLSRYEGRRICTSWYWVVAILVSTALVIILHAF